MIPENIKTKMQLSTFLEEQNTLISEKKIFQITENECLELLERYYEDEYITIKCLWILDKISTKNLRPLLLKKLSYHSRAVICWAMILLRNRAEIEDVPLLLQALSKLDKYYKPSAIKTLVLLNDERLVEPILEYVRKIVADKERVTRGHVVFSKDEPLEKSSEVIASINFLHKYPEDNKEIGKLFDNLRKRWWKHLWFEEQEWLQKRFPEQFGDLTLCN
jgi:HEAT repeat protein